MRAKGPQPRAVRIGYEAATNIRDAVELPAGLRTEFEALDYEASGAVLTAA
jgi:hypothetical protein